MKGINVAEGVANIGNEELYYSMLGDFYITIDMKIKKIQRCVLENRLRDYTIEVHALKSAVRLIGATELGDEFYQLELMGNAGDWERIEQETPAVLEHLRSFEQVLKEYVEKAEKDKQDMDISAVEGLLQDMVSASESFDLDKVDTIMKHLDNYKFPEKCLEDLKSLRIYVADVDMDEIISTCKNIDNKLREKNLEN